MSAIESTTEAGYNAYQNNGWLESIKDISASVVASINSKTSNITEATLETSGIVCVNKTVFSDWLASFTASPAEEDARILVDGGRTEESDLGDPGIYIIAVLMFYSVGIVILMINYMKKDTTESEDYYANYLEQARCRVEEHTNRGRGLNKLALGAFNAVNVIQTEEKVAFV